MNLPRLIFSAVFQRQTAPIVLITSIKGAVAGLPGITPVKVSASQAGKWICTDAAYYHGEEEYLNNVHEMKYRYDAQEGVIKYYRKTTVSDGTKTLSAYWNSTCSVPPATILGDSELRFNIYTEVSGNTMDGMTYINTCSVREGRDSTCTFYKDGTYESGYVTAKTGPDFYKKRRSAGSNKQRIWLIIF